VQRVAGGITAAAYCSALDQSGCVRSGGGTWAEAFFASPSQRAFEAGRRDILCGRRPYPSTGGDCHPHSQARRPRQSWEAFDWVYRLGNPILIRRYKLQYPNVKLALHDLYPVELDQACDRGEIDIAITRTLSLERSKNRQSRVSLRDPLVAVLPRSRKLKPKNKKIRLADLAKERFILFHQKGAPGVFDTIVGACRSQCFSPRVENEPNSMQTILSLVEAEEGVAIVPASTSNLRSNGVQFVRLAPDLYLDLIVAWQLGEPSVVLRTFLDFLNANADAIRAKAELALSSIARIRS
jgi:hypothetical protein